MAADDPTKRPGNSSSIGAWLILGLTVVTGYAAWQIMPLEGRIDSLERQNLATRDRMLAEIERLNSEVAMLRKSPVSNEAANLAPVALSSVAAAPPAPEDAAVAPEVPQVSAEPPPTAPAPEVKRTPAIDPTVYIDAHLLPPDAAIARGMLSGTPLQDIARQTQHSEAFVLARGTQLEKTLSTAPGAPRELARALQDYLRAHRP